MATPYIGEIRMVGFTFAPVGWLFCQGQLVSITQNEALFNLLGTTYGGDGQTTFGLPDLRGRTALHVGPNYPLGALGGVESVTLTTPQLPVHQHPIAAQNAGGGQPAPANSFFGTSTEAFYAAASTTTSGAMLTVTGGGQAHENQMPYLTINYIIATEGIYPTQN